MEAEFRQRVVRERAEASEPIDVEYVEAGTPASAASRRAGTQVIEASEAPSPSVQRPWYVAGGVAAGVAAVIGGVLYFRARSKEEPQISEPEGEPGQPPQSEDEEFTPQPNPGGWWDKARGLPTAAEVPGFDLEKNWGSTPKDLRPLFALMERASKIEGSARIFAVIAKREADFQATAHNDSEHEVKASRRAYANARDRNPPLKYGETAAEFGSGGLFGALAPYFLWTAVREMKGQAPLLSAHPEAMYIPRIAGFAAVAYMVGIVTYYKVEDHADIKVGWASPAILKSKQGSTYQAIRTRFFSDAAALGVDLEDTSTIPAELTAKDWPGVPAVLEALTGLTLADTREG
jgi:hypothetical protein